MQRDSLLRFSFDGLDIRGTVVRITDSFQRAVLVSEGGGVAHRLLGEALCAAAVLGNTIKVDGTLALQTHGDGAARFLLAECRDRTDLRGLVRLRREPEPDAPTGGTLGAPDPLLGRGHLAITIDPARGQRYQGITPLVETGFADAIATYFEQSEQLPTRLWLVTREAVAAGLMLQVLPPDDPSGLARHQEERSPLETRRLERDWNALQAAADAIPAQDLLEAPFERLLPDAFPTWRVRALPPETPLAFRCSCSRERTERAVQSLPRDEVETLLREDGCIEMTCEFCGSAYRFEPRDLGFGD